MVKLEKIIEEINNYGGYYYIRCNDIYEQRQLMKVLDYFHFGLGGYYDPNFTNLQQEYYEFKDNIVFRIERKKILSVFSADKLNANVKITQCSEIYELNNKITTPSDLIDYSTNPKKVIDIMENLSKSNDYVKEDFLLNVVKELIIKVNYLESYINTANYKQQESIKIEEENRKRKDREREAMRNNCLKNIYYMDSYSIKQYVNDDMKREFFQNCDNPLELKKMACIYMGNYGEADNISKLLKTQ
jgi:hypothetical protein